MPAQDLRRLAAFFQPDELEWRAITVSKRTGKGLAAAYITNRAIMERLDEVVGPANWRNEYRPGPNGGVVCGLSIFVDRGEGQPGEWVTKWDGADNTDVEAVKGGLSNAMRRAAVQWGVGRYLYDLPQQWVPVDDYKQFKQTPRVPDRFLPPRPTRSEQTRPQRPTRDEPSEPDAPSGDGAAREVEAPTRALREQPAPEQPSAPRDDPRREAAQQRRDRRTSRRNGPPEPPAGHPAHLGR
jgi:hypothetical protein